MSSCCSPTSSSATSTTTSGLIRGTTTTTADNVFTRIIPTDVMAQILQFLEMSHLRSTVKLVSKRFHAETESEMLWCLICQNAGVDCVIPASGSSWRAFAKRIGLMNGQTVSPGRGTWCPLVGYENLTSTSPSTFLRHPEPNQALPWTKRVLKPGSIEKVSSVGIIPIGFTSILHSSQQQQQLEQPLSSPSASSPNQHQHQLTNSNPALKSLDEIVHFCANVEPRLRQIHCSETDLPAPPMSAHGGSLTPRSLGDGTGSEGGYTTHHPSATTSNISTPMDSPRGAASGGIVLPTIPSIEYFDICPATDDQTRFLALRLSGCDIDRNLDGEEENIAARHVARLVEVMWSTCSSLVFAVNPAMNPRAVRHWFALVGSRLSEATRADSMFCTGANTPDVSFVSLPEGCSSIQDVKHDFPFNFKSWLTYRSNKVEFCRNVNSCVDSLLPLPKPYAIPGWISALVCPGLTPAYLLEMTVFAAVGHPRVDLWSVNAMQRVLKGAAAHTIDFYEKAMNTELQEKTKGDSVPLENPEMVVTHRHFFFAALRSYSLQLSRICGQDIAAGTQLLETVKRDANTAFRDLYRTNGQLCKQVCGTIFEHIFASATSNEVYLSSKFQTRGALKYWIDVIDEKIELYLSISKGPRRYDVLAEKMGTDVIPQMMSWAASHPDHPYIHPESVVLATKELRNKADRLLFDFRNQLDETLSKMQRETAVYTSMTGSEWAAGCHADNAQAMIQKRHHSEQWEMDMLRREHDFGIDSEQQQLAAPQQNDHLDDEEAMALAMQPLPLLRSAEIHAEMAAEGEQRAAAAKTAADLAQQRTFMKDVNVVNRTSSTGLLGAIRRRLTN